ncbi:MAG: transglutaminase domain-containing protein [Clostridia bacterium]|nr:transglutaminase domain-containing protein [Clostridia bacterium]
MKTMLKRIVNIVLAAAIIMATVGTAAAASVKVSVAGAKKTAQPSTVDTQYFSLDTESRNDGYISIRYNKKTDKDIRVYIYKDNEFDVTGLTYEQGWKTLGLTNGSGTYTIKVYEHAYDNLYYNRGQTDVIVEAADPIKPFLFSNHKINICSAPKTEAAAASITAGCVSVKEQINAIHRYVATGITYDYNRKTDAQSGALAFEEINLDAILERKSGICIDYAALMCGMLRSRGIAAKMEFGYLADGKYHAWVKAFDPEAGWVRYDPSTYSVGYQINLPWVEAYISNDANYVSVTETF